MNCHEFRLHQFNAARTSGPMASKAKTSQARPCIEDARQHAVVCAACAELLIEQREVSARLQQLALSDALYSPSPEQERVLRAAYRTLSQTEDRIVVPSSASNWKPWAATIAAMLLVTLVGIDLSQEIPGWFVTSSADQPNISVVKTDPVPEAVQHLTPPAVPRPSLKPRAARKGSQEKQPTAFLGTRDALAPVTAVSPAAQADEAQSAPSTSQQILGEEAVSDFVPLPFDGDPMLAGSGPIVRVELSGAALRSLGLSLGFPVAVESSGRLVQADLMLGQDGFARAIRFVR